jgi:Na+/H+ antiporter NhaD/arsenite permease-like protein
MSGIQLPEELPDMQPGPRLARLLSTLDPTRLNGWQLAVVLDAQNRQLAHDQARMLAVARELAYAPPCGSDSPPDRQAEPNPFVGTEISMALTWTEYTAASLAVGAFVVALVAGVSIYWTTPICAAGLLLAFAVWDHSRLGWRLVPWQLLVSVAGLFLVVDAVSRHGLSSAMTTLIGADPGPAGISRAAGTGAVLSNVLNNLTVYRAGESVVPIANHNQMLGLLIGTNVAPLITPWASLATLLWAQRCRAAGVDIRWSRFALTGAVTALVVTAASTASLIAWG